MKYLPMGVVKKVITKC